MVYPHICKVKHGELEFFAHNGMSKAAQSSSQTSAQSMPKTSSETWQREQQMHAQTSSQSLVFLLL